MKHHNKFKVTAANSPHEYEIKFATLGGFYVPFNGNIDVNIIEVDALSLEALLNGVYDQAYENGRKAVRVCMNEAMGFDGE
jgi:hypothetical protein